MVIRSKCWMRPSILSISVAGSSKGSAMVTGPRVGGLLLIPCSGLSSNQWRTDALTVQDPDPAGAAQSERCEDGIHDQGPAILDAVSEL